jgi:ABC-type nitrate/sulfonate/bicarbonate transport system substrate-binding protein
MAPLWVAKDAGIFDKYGFDVEFITLQSSSQVAKVMASGEISLALSAAAGVVDAALAGDDQVLISSYQPYMNFWVHARPDVTRIADLRGKRVGATRIGSGAHLGVVEMLRKAGLEPDQDAAVMQLGGMPEVYGALTAGAIDAGIFSMPWNFRAQDEGFPQLHDVSADRIPYLQTGLATSRQYLRQNEALVRRFMMAHLEGLARVHTDKPTTVESIARNLKSEDLALMERTYDTMVPLLERIPYPVAPSIQTVIDQRAAENPAARNLTPAQVSDERYVRELEDSGFIAQLYRS